MQLNTHNMCMCLKPVLGFSAYVRKPVFSIWIMKKVYTFTFTSGNLMKSLKRNSQFYRINVGY